MSYDTRLDLANNVAGYLHRTDITSQILDFITLATKRIGRELRSSENEVSAVFTMVTNPQGLPADFRSLREIYYQSNGGNTELRATSLQELARNSFPPGGKPRFYSIQGTVLKTAPTSLMDYQILYFAEPAALVNDTDTNSVLQVYPDLYLYATLMEAYFYTQDGDLFSAAQQTYRAQLKQINIVSESARVGAAPAMRV